MSTTLKIEDYLARGDCEFARSQGLDDATIGDPFSDSEEGGERQRDQPLPDRMARASSKSRSFPPQSSSGRKKRKVLASLINSPAEAAHNELFEPLTDGHDEMPAEEHSDFTEDLTEDRHFRLQDDDENCNGSDHDSKVSAGDNNTQPCRQSSQMELELDEAALQDYSDYAHSGADDEEARAYNLIDRGLATDPDMKHLEIVLAHSIGDSSRGAQLDPSSERKLDKKTFKLKKISDHIGQHRDPIYLMVNYVDNSLVFSDEHIVYWFTFFRIFKAEDHDSKDRFFKAYEDVLGNVADQIMKGRREAGSHAFDWRRYLWNTFVEPLRKEALSLSPALIRTVTWESAT
ncbi:hypothetical protein MVLG_02318 [Microbotryum lychnidis-dioicae p1A1 Lamole]|uniref:Uncharacterized protein n=1 Tax=Microbotryum lychnidis-dioicae (strain p1A1 Lamole / MvSl-1064) TaxID=683840 RepID=U5H4T2_USTV1|nr:hypothetical protein MVLG_02318 [Microbotryum lychnidis-dioicae p1A1 Lamole]|eukprot:KDE07453.1 hypothetical protein MVLG_02318 [Microbotryum lychnidis-dioicae p1A1 Lamole]